MILRGHAENFMDGLISFFASYHAIRADTILRRAGFVAKLIPGPRELSPNCGVALRFEFVQKDPILAMLSEKKVKIDGVHHYQPRTDDWNAAR